MLLLTLVSAVWAFSFVLIKGTLAGLDSSFVSLIRMLLSLAVFLPFLRREAFAPVLRVQLVGIGAIQFGLMYVTYIAAFRYLPAHMVVLLTATTPLFVTLLNDLGKRRFHGRFLLAAGLAVAGGVVLKYPSQPLAASIAGIVLLQVSNLAFAFGQLAYKRVAAGRPQWRDREAMAWLYVGGVMATTAAALVTTDFEKLTVSPVQWMTLAYLGVIASGVCFFLWNMGARSVNEGALAVMNNLKIPLGILATLLLLHEATDYGRLTAGFGLMLAALWVNERWLLHGRSPLTAGQKRLY